MKEHKKSCDLKCYRNKNSKILKSLSTPVTAGSVPATAVSEPASETPVSCDSSNVQTFPATSQRKRIPNFVDQMSLNVKENADIGSSIHLFSQSTISVSKITETLDPASRSIDPRELRDHRLWWTGSIWL